jgi:hypothetical protein
VDLSRATRSVSPDLTFVPYLPGWLLPLHFSVTWNDGASPLVTMDVITGADGRPHVKSVAVRGQRDQDVSGTELREVRVAELLADAVAHAVMRDGKSGPRFKSAEDFRAYRESHPAKQWKRERWLLTPEHLREVLRIYQSGGGAEGAGVIAVAEHFDKPRPTASRWVQKAKVQAESQGPKRPRKGSR